MHKLLSDRPGEKILVLGNEAIARGAVEAGVAFATTYPGTPSSEISLNLFQISQESDLYFEYSTNEKVALEVAAGAAASGLRTFCMMKHVGLNVAADPLMTLAYVGVTGGLVILTADDPFMFS
ncbi:MAG TPA: indolepyruvate ferredoxin oxidoreductase subunit alpha, partial [Desulfosarcina sp.]|nr:indolepyruvate ferredoxin oxidoreductase subunit alpha [Desulfosarcina sp.]